MELVGLYMYVDINAVANGGKLQLHVRRDFYTIIFKIKQVMIYSLRVKHPHPPIPVQDFQFASARE